MKIYKTFRKLTQFTYVYGDEHLLKEYLPTEVETDEIGNFFLEIGESETMFCSHLDTAAHSMQRVKHVQFITKNKHDIITTNGTTVLGADDKAGVVIMLNMIEKKVPGLYYFFVGEERGLIGSKGILRLKSERFDKYKRCISFDRRDYGSIISAQMGGTCCSQEFVNALADNFAEHNMSFHDDKGGVYTDSAVFMPIIPEVTNLSVGYFNEHSHHEIQNLTYLAKLADVATKINWEALPVARVIRPTNTPNPVRKEKIMGDLDDRELFGIFQDVDDVISRVLTVSCTNYRYFIPEKEMLFSDYYDNDKYFSIWIHEDGSITINYENYNKDGIEEFHSFDSFFEVFIEKVNNMNKLEQEEEEEWEEEEWEEEEWDEEESIERDNKLNDENDQHITSVDNFEKNVDLNELKSNINLILDDTNKDYISVEDMDELLQKYNVEVETMIYWIFEKGENVSPAKTYGILWDGENYRFVIK